MCTCTYVYVAVRMYVCLYVCGHPDDLDDLVRGSGERGDGNTLFLSLSVCPSRSNSYMCMCARLHTAFSMRRGAYIFIIRARPLAGWSAAQKAGTCASSRSFSLTRARVC